MILAIDAFLRSQVFQPLVDLLAWWQSRFGLAIFCTIGSILGVIVATALVLDRQPPTTAAWMLVPSALLLITFWSLLIWDYVREAAREAAGRIARPLSTPRVRVQDTAICWAFWLVACAPPPGTLSLFTMSAAYTLFCAGRYFAACQPTLPKHRRVWSVASG